MAWNFQAISCMVFFNKKNAYEKSHHSTGIYFKKKSSPYKKKGVNRPKS